MAEAPGAGPLLLCFLVEEEGCEVVGGFRNFLNFSLLTLSSSSAAFSATFQSRPSTIFIHLGVNMLLAAGALLRLVDVGEMDQPMRSWEMLKSAKSIGSPVRLNSFKTGS